MRRLSTLGAALGGICAISGCGRGAPEPMPTVPVAPAPPAATGPWPAYLDAARAVGDQDVSQLTRNNFTNFYRDKLMARCEKGVSLVLNAAGEGPFPYVPAAPDGPSEHRLQWRAIGRCLVWRIEALRGKGLNRDAGAVFARGTRFAYDLAGGDAADATLGFAIAAELREAFLPVLPSLTRDELIALSKSLRVAMAHRPDMARVAAHERLAAHRGVTWLMEHGLDGKAMVGEFGRDGRALRDYLKNSPNKRVMFYRGLLDEIDREAKIVVEMSAKPPSERMAEEEWMKDLPKGRVWRKAAFHLARGMRPILPLNDLDLTRIRLLALEIEIRRRIKETDRPFANLNAFSVAARTDPYSGGDFHYRFTGREFLVWSTGVDGKDDQGRTDMNGLEPDLILGEILRR